MHFQFKLNFEVIVVVIEQKLKKIAVSQRYF